MRRSVRQHLAGLAVNARAQPSRTEYDRLRALLHDCVVRGPILANHEATPDFRAHLAGRVAWHARASESRARKLGALFARIAW